MTDPQADRAIDKTMDRLPYVAPKNSIIISTCQLGRGQVIINVLCEL